MVRFKFGKDNITVYEKRIVGTLLQEFRREMTWTWTVALR